MSQFYASSASLGLTGRVERADAANVVGGKVMSKIDATDVYNLTATFDGGGSAITTGTKISCQVKYNCTITSWTALSVDSTTGSIQVDINKSDYSGFPTTATITAGNPITITTAQKNTDSTLTGWTTTITAGDVIEFEVDSVTSLKLVTITLGLLIN